MQHIIHNIEFTIAWPAQSLWPPQSPEQPTSVEPKVVSLYSQTKATSPVWLTTDRGGGGGALYRVLPKA